MYVHMEKDLEKGVLKRETESQGVTTRQGDRKREVVSRASNRERCRGT